MKNSSKQCSLLFFNNIVNNYDIFNAVVNKKEMIKNVLLTET